MLHNAFRRFCMKQCATSPLVMNSRIDVDCRNGCNSVHTGPDAPLNLDRRSKDADEFLLNKLPQLMQQTFQTYTDKQGKVVDFLQPEELYKQIDFTFHDNPTTNDELQQLCELAIKYSVKTGHPYFYNQLFTGVDKYALSGALLSETLNASAYTYEIGPAVCFMEREIINKVGLELIGYDQVDGIFCPGGSICNMYGLSLARHNKFPESRDRGMQGIPRVHVYTSALSHYSLKKASFFLGLGLDNLIDIPADAAGRMIPEELDAAIRKSLSEGVVPLMVNATSGTTVFGAYDPLDKIADVCQQHNVWLHVDACWGGSVLLSHDLREQRMKGVERADSLVWDPHKMAGSILQCSLIVTKHDKIYDPSYDTGDKSIQCGRKIDAFKLWVQWKAYGNSGMAQRIECCFSNAWYLTKKVEETEGFQLLLQPECTNVCFWYIPPSLRGQEETPEWKEKLSRVAPVIKGRMQEQGTMMIGYQPQGDFVNFFRMICSNPVNTEADMDHIVEEIIRLGQDL